MKEIQLTQGKVALVDDEDYEMLMEHKWCANFVGTKYYAMTNIKRKPIRMHKLILNTPKGKVVDHINGNGLDNRRCNIRICTQSNNCMNSSKSKNKKSSIHKGVYFDKSRNKFYTYIEKNGKRRHLGRFASEIEAALAYNKAAIELFGEYAKLNKI